MPSWSSKHLVLYYWHYTASERHSFAVLAFAMSVWLFKKMGQAAQAPARRCRSSKVVTPVVAVCLFLTPVEL
jgi:hypothetical protein